MKGIWQFSWISFGWKHLIFFRKKGCADVVCIEELYMFLLEYGGHEGFQHVPASTLKTWKWLKNMRWEFVPWDLSFFFCQDEIWSPQFVRLSDVRMIRSCCLGGHRKRLKKITQQWSFQYLTETKRGGDFMDQPFCGVEGSVFFHEKLACASNKAGSLPVISRDT